MPSYNELGHVCGVTERICVNAAEHSMHSRWWLYYEGCRDPWREVASIDRESFVYFPDGTYRRLLTGMHIYVELAT